MKVHETPLPGVLLVEPRVFQDHRGFFLEFFNDARFRAHGLPDRFCQDNHSRSSRGVLRGLHFQTRQPQGKLVTAIHGTIFDVVVDVRRGSPTFGRWFGTLLSGDEPRYLWVPPGFAHGFCVLSDHADVVYKCTTLYRAEDDRGVHWSDSAVGIVWPVQDPIISEKDRGLPGLDPLRDDLPRFAL